MTKRRQHYVWKKYLEAWTKNNNIYCCKSDREPPVFKTTTINSAVERNFYNINDLNREDINSIIDTINHDKNTSESENQFRKELLNEILNFLDKKDNFKNEKIFKNNFFENKYMDIENNFLPILKKILNKDISFYNQEKYCYNFIYYLTSQYMRTKAIKEKENSYIKKYQNKDVSRIWNILSYFTAHSICSLIFSQRDKRKLYLLENKSDVDFLTSDQPVLNLAPSPKYCLYFPVSPRIAILLQEEDENPIQEEDENPMFQTKNLEKYMVEDFNNKIIEQSSTTVFSQKEETIHEAFDVYNFHKTMEAFS